MELYPRSPCMLSWRDLYRDDVAVSNEKRWGSLPHINIFDLPQIRFRLDSRSVEFTVGSMFKFRTFQGHLSDCKCTFGELPKLAVCFVVSLRFVVSPSARNNSVPARPIFKCELRTVEGGEGVKLVEKIQVQTRLKSGTN